MITKEKLKENKIVLTREQISLRAIEIGEMCAKGSYKNAVACIGRMVALSKTIDDSYWKGKFWDGVELESYFLLSNLNNNHPDKNTTLS